MEGYPKARTLSYILIPYQTIHGHHLHTSQTPSYIIHQTIPAHRPSHTNVLDSPPFHTDPLTPQASPFNMWITVEASYVMRCDDLVYVWGVSVLRRPPIWMKCEWCRDDVNDAVTMWMMPWRPPVCIRCECAATTLCMYEVWMCSDDLLYVWGVNVLCVNG